MWRAATRATTQQRQRASLGDWVWRLWAHTCVQHGLGRTVTCGRRLGGGQAQGAVLVKLKGYSHPAARGELAGRREKNITFCARDFFRSTRGANCSHSTTLLLTFGDQDIRGSGFKQFSTCRLFPPSLGKLIKLISTCPCLASARVIRGSTPRQCGARRAVVRHDAAPGTHGSRAHRCARRLY